MRMYNATIEVDHRGDFDVDQVMTQLEAFHPAIGQSRRGLASATISLPGETLTQATAAAVAVVEQAFGVWAVYAEVMTEREFNAREGWEDVPELVSVSEAAQLLGVSRQAVLQRITAKTLPAEKVGREYVIPRAAVARTAGA